MKRLKWKFATGDRVKFRFSNGEVATGRITGVDRGVMRFIGFSYYRIAIKQPHIRLKAWWVGEPKIIRKLPKSRTVDINIRKLCQYSLIKTI